MAPSQQNVSRTRPWGGTGHKLQVVKSKPQTKKKTKTIAKKRALGRVDLPLVTLITLLLLFGLVVLFSASFPTGHVRRGNSYAFILPQLRNALLGIGVMVVASRIDYKMLRKLAWPLMALTIFLLVAVLFAEERNGARRWIWGFQPSEIAKFAVILLFAAIIAANQKKIKQFMYGYVPLVSVLGVVLVLLFFEPHLSCMILILGIGFFMMVSGGTNNAYLIISVVGAVALVFVVLTYFPDLLPSYAHDRLAIWQDPFIDADDLGHQTIQSLIAIGSGGLTGSGIGQSVQKYFYLPEMYNDYIFAVLCEELGFIGAMAVIILFLLVLLRGLYIATRVEDKFGSMLVVGISVQIALQALLHIAVNINAIPSTGISMPFFSYGGTSLIMLMGEVGIMLNVSRQLDKPALQRDRHAPALQKAAGE